MQVARTGSTLMTMKIYSLALIGCAFAPALLAQQNYPTPTAPMQAIIDKDNGRKFGDSPADPGPMAKDLSPALKPADIDKAVKKVADWELARHMDSFDQIWTSSVDYAGFMAASRSTGDPKYRDAMLAVANKYEWKPRGKGANADDQSIAQMYLELYLAQPKDKRDPHWIEPTRAAMDAVIGVGMGPDQGVEGPGTKDARIPWWWCDALFMAPAVWAQMAEATGDRKYIDYIHTNWQRTYDALYNKDQHLYARDATYKDKKEPNGQPQFWSRGEGWVMGGIARTVDYLPKDDPQIPFYIGQLKEMAVRVKELQGPDGLWHAGLLDPDYYKLPEISGSALFTYAIAWGINHGYLDAKTYRPVVEKAWKGMLGHISADGRLGCIQQTGSEPAFYYPGSSYDYGIGAFMLAGSELKTMAAKTGK
jgi:unsaturated rhamnogalacturonyl hydrolase